MKLITSKSYGKIQKERRLKGEITPLECCELRDNYDNFLDQTLEFGKFDGDNQLFQCELFHGAVMCEGHNIDAIVKNFKTIEDLIFMSPTLTPSAIKQIGL